MLTVDVYSDPICPWCWIGKRRLEKAVRSLAGRHEVRVVWHPYRLNPQMPKGGLNRREYRTAKFGSWERSQALDAKIVSVGESEGVAFNFNEAERTPNTLDAHRLIWLAGRQGVQDAVVESLFIAYFTDGNDIGDRETLVEIAAEAGLDRGFVESLLDGGDGLEAVLGAEEDARRIGVEGVPFFVINGTVGLSGAQAPEVFVAAFESVVASRAEGETGSCSVGSGEDDTRNTTGTDACC